MATALEIAQSVAATIGIRSPTTLIGTTTGHAGRLRALMDRGCRRLARKRGPHLQSWPELTREHLFTTVAGQRSYALPSGFQNVVNDTIWDRTSEWPAIGQLSPQEDAELLSGRYQAGTLSPLYRIKLNENTSAVEFFLDPTPGNSGEELSFEYISTFWARESATGPITKDSITADSDVPVFPVDIVELDLEWRMRRSMGDPTWGVALGEFESTLDVAFAEKVGARDINLSGTSSFQDDYLPAGHVIVG